MKAPTFPFKDLFKSLREGFMTRADLALSVSETKGGVVRFPIPFKEIYFISEPSAVKRIMIDNSKNYVKTPDYKFLAELLGEGLLTKNDTDWIKDRQLIQPLFRADKLQEFASVIQSETEAFCEEIKQSSGVVDTEKAYSILGLKIIGKWALGLDVTEYCEDISEVLRVGQKRVLEKGWSLLDFSMLFRTKKEKEFQEALQKMKNIIREMMEKAKVEEPLTNLYSLLKHAEKEDDEIIDHLITFFMAGHETTAVALCWTSYLLAKNQDIQQKLKQSLVERPASNSPMDIPPYLHSVLDESMRIFPPISFIGRMSKERDEIAGYKIKKGALLAICPLATHRNKVYWDDPMLMKPSRFDKENKNEIETGKYYPFALGPRRCIAMHMAMMELHIIMKEVVKNFELLPIKGEPEPKPVPLISMKPNGPLLINFKSRVK